MASRIVHLPLSWDDPATRLAIRKYTQSVRPDAPWCPSNIEFIRRINGLASVDDVKRIVYEASYLVLGLGDVYLGAPVATPLDPRHRLVTTKYNPARTWTPENAVGIGGAYLCVYGMEGPGGYQFVGRTCQMWNRFHETPDFVPGSPWLLRFFDQIRFYEVSADELLAFRAAFPRGRVAAAHRGDVVPVRRLPRVPRRQRRFDRGVSQRSSARRSSPSASAGRRCRRRQTRPSWPPPTTEQALPEGAVAVRAAVTGSVWEVAVPTGARVAAGDRLVIIETMKMETPVLAPAAGTVVVVCCTPGALVRAGPDAGRAAARRVAAHVTSRHGGRAGARSSTPTGSRLTTKPRSRICASRSDSARGCCWSGRWRCSCSSSSPTRSNPFSMRGLLILVSVLLFHELGHFVGMRVFGYRDVKHVLHPVLCAAVSGKRGARSLPGSRASFVAPPGAGHRDRVRDRARRQGAACRRRCARSRSRWSPSTCSTCCRSRGLDGARLLQLVLFSRRRWLEIAFQTCAGLRGGRACAELAKHRARHLRRLHADAAAVSLARAESSGSRRGGAASRYPRTRRRWTARRAAWCSTRRAAPLTSEGNRKPPAIAGAMEQVLDAAIAKRPSAEASIGLGVTLFVAFVVGAVALMLVAAPLSG